MGDSDEDGFTEEFVRWEQVRIINITDTSFEYDLFR